MQIKKHVALFIIIIFSLLNSKAQDLSRYSFGLKLEPNINWVGVDSKKVGAGVNGLSINYGLIVNNNISNKVAISSGITVFNLAPQMILNDVFVKNMSTNKVDSLTNLTTTYALRYLEVPLMLTMNTGLINNKSFYGEFGLSTAFLIKAKADINGGSHNLKNVNIQSPEEGDILEIKENGSNYPYSQKVSQLRFGGIIGAGIKFSILQDSYVTTGLRFNLGLNSFVQEEKWQIVTSYGSVNIGFIF